MPTIFLRQGEANPTTVRLRNPVITGRLFASSSLAIASQAHLTAYPRLVATAAVTVNSAGRLNVMSPLESTSAIAIDAPAPSLTITAALRGASTITVVSTAQLTITAEFSARSAISSASTAALLAGARFSADARVMVASTAFLTRLAQFFAATSGIALTSRADLRLAGYGATNVAIAFNNVLQTTGVRVGSITISDELNETANRCDFLVDGVPPSVGTDVKMGLRNLLPGDLVFAGTVTQISERYELRRDHRVWAVSCTDYTFLLNRRLVFEAFTDLSATTAAQRIVTKYAPGFSTAGIVGGLPAITATYDGTPVMSALSDLAERCGAYTSVNYSKVVRLGPADLSDPPHAIDASGRVAFTRNDPPFTYRQDEQQVRTRVLVRGKSASVAGPEDFNVPAGSTQLPIDDPSIFSAGTIITADTQIVSYGGVTAGGNASTVGGAVQPPAFPPSASIAVGVAGQLNGVYRWAYAFGNAGGETPISPVSGPVTASAFQPPSFPVGLGASGGLGPLVGAYSYRVTFLTSLGETLMGPPAARTAIPALAQNPSLGISVAANVVGVSALSPGAYQWKYTLVTSFGETAGSSAVGSATMNALSAPAAPSVSALPGPGPLLPGSTYAYRATFVTAYGETAMGSANSLTPSGLSMPGFSGSPASFGGLTSGGVYYHAITLVTASGESLPLAGSSFTAPSNTPPGNPAWTGLQDPSGAGRIAAGGITYYWACSCYSDRFGETALGPSIFVNVGGTLPLRLLFNLPGMIPNADGLRLYRAISGSTFQLVEDWRWGSMPSQYWDYKATAELGAQYPVQTLRAGIRMVQTLFASGETGVLARRLYRSKAGGTELFLVAEVQHNINGTIVIDTTSDDQLIQRSPLLTTTGRQASVGLPIGPAGTVARRLYRTKAGGSQYYLVAEVRDNTTAVITDATPDTALMAAGPGVSTAGSGMGTFSTQQPRVTVPTGPSGVTKRRLYRTKAGGSVFYLLAELSDNTTTVFDDNTPDVGLGGATMPGVSTAGGEQHQLTSVPIGPAGTLGRRIYRTTAGGSQYFRVGDLGDNTSTTFLDAVPDNALGQMAPLINTAGAAAANLSIPIGPPGVTQRIIFRTVAGGSQYKYLGTIDDNGTTSFLDTRADNELGRTPQLVSTIGALPGDASVQLLSAVGWPSAGWFEADGQTIRYEGITGNTLIGIPPLLSVASLSRIGLTAYATTFIPHNYTSGQRVVIVGANESEYTGARTITVTGWTTFTYAIVASAPANATGTIRASTAGAIIAGIAGGSTATTVPMLTGVSGLVTAVAPGDRISLWVVRDSLAGQALLAAAEGGDGVREYLVNDGALDSVKACAARGDAELALFQFVSLEVRYDCHDPKTRSGASVHVDTGPPQNIVGDFLIQSVRISDLDMYPRIPPRYSVVASNARFSLEDILRHVVLDT